MWWNKKWKSTDGVRVVLKMSDHSGIPIVEMLTLEPQQVEFVRQWVSRLNQQADRGVPLVHKP